jgi:hypothetical protein
MSMKKLWATVLTGLLSCTAISRAEDPVAPGTLVPMPPAVRTTNTPPSPYAVIPTLPPIVITTSTDDAKAPKTTTEPVTRVQPKTLNYRPAILETADAKSPEVKIPPVLKPAETKWSAPKPSVIDTPMPMMKERGAADPKAVTTLSADVKAGSKGSEPKMSVIDGPAPLVKDGKPGDAKEPVTPAPDLKPVAPPGSVFLPGRDSAPGCAGCTPCTKPCETCRDGCGWGSGKLRRWLSYHPCRTPLSECAGAYRVPDIYTFFLDVPCRETWKPVECCEKPCGTCGPCGQAGSCGPTSSGPVPAPVPELLPTPHPTPASLPAPRPTPPGRGFATDR